MIVPTQRLFGLDIMAGLGSQAVEYLEDVLLGKKRSSTFVVFTPNPEQIVISQTDVDFHQALQRADFLLPDGVGLVWASRLLGLPLCERVTGVDTVKQLLELCATSPENPHVLILGGRGYHQRHLEGSQLLVQDIAKQPFSQVVWSEGYKDKSHPTAEEEKNVLTWIEAHRTALVLVALGAPWQEKWIISHLEFLTKSGVRIAMGVGGTIDYLTGVTPRAPRIIQYLGLEWLYRLLREPWRWKRQLRLLEFVWLVVGKSLGRK